MGSSIDILLEVFIWAGFAGAALLAMIALVLLLIDGTWLPVAAIIDDSASGRVARLFAHDGTVGVAHLDAATIERLGNVDAAELFARVGGAPRVRLVRRWPLVRLAAWLAVGFAALGVVAAAASLLMLFTAG